MSLPVVAATKSIKRVRECENLTKIRTVGRVTQSQLPLLEICHDKKLLTINLENCLPTSWIDSRSDIPEVNDTVMIIGEVNKFTEDLAFDGTTITVNALLYKVCNGLNISKWSDAVDERG